MRILVCGWCWSSSYGTALDKVFLCETFYIICIRTSMRIVCNCCGNKQQFSQCFVANSNISRNSNQNIPVLLCLQDVYFEIHCYRTDDSVRKIRQCIVHTGA